LTRAIKPVKHIFVYGKKEVFNNMSKSAKPNQKSKLLGFRLDAEDHEALMKLAEDKGVTVSDFFRGVVEKVLAPAQREQDETRAEIEALPPGAKKRALRAIEIQKRLRALRLARPKVHALSSLFQDGDGDVQDAETVRLENELASLKKAFEAEVVGVPAPSEDEAQVEVQTAEGEGEDEGQDADPDEAEDEEETAAEKEEVNQFLEVTRLINLLRGPRVKKSFWDDVFFPIDWFRPRELSACEKLIAMLEGVRSDGAPLSERELEELRQGVASAVELRATIAESEASAADGPTIKKLKGELENKFEAMAAGFGDAAEKKKKTGKGSGSSSRFLMF
jgi:hypothetical protein